MNLEQVVNVLITENTPKDGVVPVSIVNIHTQDGNVQIILEAKSTQADVLSKIQQQIEAEIAKISGISSVKVALTAHRQQAPSKKLSLPGVKAIIAVASGKGGVGKSTTALNLALALSKLGHKIGLLDADIYGPSMPRMLGINEKPAVNQDKKLIPLDRYGLKVMSIGFMVPEDSPMIWRGPMVQSALQQMLHDVAWTQDDEYLDLLIVDMPPGTGDAQLTLAQQVSLTGAVIVSTPQDIALIDARKGLNMFHRVNVPILGIIENMSFFCCPKCGEVSEIFSHGGASREAKNLGVPFLGEVPIDLKIRLGSDQGTSVIIDDPQSKSALIYNQIALNVWEELQKVHQRVPSILVS